MTCVGYAKWHLNYIFNSCLGWGTSGTHIGAWQGDFYKPKKLFRAKILCDTSSVPNCLLSSQNENLKIIQFFHEKLKKN